MFEVTFPDAIGGEYTVLMEPKKFYPLLNRMSYVHTNTLDTGHTVVYSSSGRRMIYLFVMDKEVHNG